MGRRGSFSLLVCYVALLGRAASADPLPTLSATGLYQNILDKKIAEGVRHFTPQYPLWADGATKDRWIQLPPGTTINTADIDNWVFPLGTKLWKEFRFADKRVETRLMEKLEDGTWEFASYLWNAGETEATLASADGVKNYFPITDTVQHDIPAVADCLSCHKRKGDRVLGFELLQLSGDRDPHALHAVAPAAGDWQLPVLLAEGRLSAVPESLIHAQPRIVASSAIARSALGYLHVNCGSCHNPKGSGSLVNSHFRHPYSASTPEEAPAYALNVNQPTTNFLIPGQFESIRIRPGDPANSVVYYRMNLPAVDRMPSKGTKIHDAEGLALIKRWIEELPH